MLVRTISKCLVLDYLDSCSIDWPKYISLQDGKSTKSLFSDTDSTLRYVWLIPQYGPTDSLLGRL